MIIKERRTAILLALFLFAGEEKPYVMITDKMEGAFDFSLNLKTRSTLSKLSQEGLIESQSEREYLLTADGFAVLCLQFPFFRFLKGSWDRKWRILSYEIPERKRELRDKLRREVAGWGLGPWHRSFWLTPHPIIESLRLRTAGGPEEKYVQAFEADHAYGNTEILIEKVWATESLAVTYRELFKKWHAILSEEIEKTEKLRKVIQEYIAVLRIDPGLPRELIGEDWIGFEAYIIFNDIKGILTS